MTTPLKQFIQFNTDIIDLLVDVQHNSPFDTIQCNQHNKELLINAYSRFICEGYMTHLDYYNYVNREVKWAIELNEIKLCGAWCKFVDSPTNCIKLIKNSDIVWVIEDNLDERN